MNSLFETLRPNDLQFLVSDILSIDQYTSKTKADDLTIGININDKSAAHELSQLLTKLFLNTIQDVEVSDNLTDNDEYTVFVEFKRTKQLIGIIEDLVDVLTRLTGLKKWYFKTDLINDDPLEVNKDNLLANIRCTPIQVKGIKDATNGKEDKEKEIKEFLETGVFKRAGNSIIVEDEYDRYNWKIEGFITEEQFDREIEEAEEVGSPSYLTLVEAFPCHQFYEADDYLYLQRDNKILKLKYLG